MDMFYALAEPTRRSILDILARCGAMPAKDIYNKFNVSAPAISQHLRVLREANLVHIEKRAQQRIYKINTDALLGIEAWARQTKDMWTDRFDKLEVVLKQNQSNPRKKRKIGG